MTNIQALQKQPLFSWISTAPLEALLAKAKTSSLKTGATLYSAGSCGEAIYLILEGSIQFSPPSAKRIVLEEGSLFGECSIIEIKKHPCTATARTDSRILILDHTALLEFSRDYPDPYSIIVTNLARCLSERIRKLNTQKAPKTGPSAKGDSHEH